MKATVALTDDHILLRNGLANLLTELGYTVLFQADNGRQLIEKISTHTVPQVVIMDINMPVMDGYEATLWLKENHPSVKVLALSMLDDETSLIRMFKNGAHGYILKDCHPDELQKAIETLLKKGFYHSEVIGQKLIRAIHHLDEINISMPPEKLVLTDKEVEFLKWVCTEFSYKEIADKMGVSPRTVDGYRDALQEKLECKGRIGLALWAIRQGVVEV
jgi:two-component system, NarL family, invasion response regulator UvrY